MAKRNAFFDKNATKVTKEDVDGLLKMYNNAQTKAEEDANKVRTDFNEGLNNPSLPTNSDISNLYKEQTKSIPVLTSKTNQNLIPANAIPNNATISSLSPNTTVINDSNASKLLSREDNIARKKKEASLNRDTEWASNHPVLATGKKILESPVIGVGNTVDNIDSLITGKGSGDKFARQYRNLTEGVKSNIDTNLGETAYDVTTGLLEMLYNNAISGNRGMFGALTGGKSVGELKLDAKERGASERQASAYGLLGGGLSGLMNAKGMEVIEKNLAKESAKSLADVGRNIGVGALAEGTENLVETTGQELLDNIINGNDSQFNEDYAYAISSGMDENSAMNYAVKNLGARISQSALSGAVMGGAFAGVKAGGQLAKNNGITLDSVSNALNENMTNSFNSYGRNIVGANAPRITDTDVKNSVPELEMPNKITEQSANNSNIEAPKAEEITRPIVNNVDDVTEKPTEITNNNVNTNAVEPDDFVKSNVASLYSDIKTSIDGGKSASTVNNKINKLINFIGNDSEVSREYKTEIRSIVRNVDLSDEQKIASLVDVANRFEDEVIGTEIPNNSIANSGVETTDMGVIKEQIANGDYATALKNLDAVQNSDTASVKDVMEAETLFDEVRALATEDKTQLRKSKATPKVEEDLASQYARLTGIDDENFIDSLRTDIANNDTDYIREGLDAYIRTNPDNVSQKILNQHKKIRDALYDRAIVDENGNIKNGEYPIDNVRDAETLLDHLNNQISLNAFSESDADRLQQNTDAVKRWINKHNSEPEVWANEDVGLLEEAPTERPKFTEEVATPNNSIVMEEEYTPARTGTTENGYSKVVSNTAVNSEIDRGIEPEVLNSIAEYSVEHESSSFDAAYDSVDTEAKARDWENKYISGEQSIESNVDVDRTMLIMHELATKYDDAIAKGDTKLAEQINARRSLLLSRLRESGTKAGREIQAFAKWNRTPEGARINAERLKSETTAKYYKTHTRESEYIDNISDDLVNNRTTTSDDNSSNRSNRRNNSNKKNKVNEKKVINGVEFDANIDNRTPENSSYVLNKALEEFDNDNTIQADIAKNSVKTHDDYVNEVKNTFDKELAEISDYFEESDYEHFANMIENKVSRAQLKSEIRARLEGRNYRDYDTRWEESKELNKVLDELVNGKKEVEEKPPRTYEEVVEQVRNTLDRYNKFGNFNKEFTDDDVNYIANLIHYGATSEELSNAIKTKLVTGSFGISEDAMKKVNTIFDEAKQYDVNSKARYKKEIEAYAILANEIGAKKTLSEKFDAWRYLAMLGNPKTHMRNIVGNTMFQAVTGTSNNVAAMLEGITDATVKGGKYIGSKITGNEYDGKGIDRTKAILNPLNADDRAMIKASGKDADNRNYRALSGNKWGESIRNDIKSQMSSFRSKALQGIDDANSRALDAEDYVAMKNKYKTSLAGYVKANGGSIDAFKAEQRYTDLENSTKGRLRTAEEQAEMDSLYNDAKLIRDGRKYATAQAEYSAFHEDNAVATLLSNWSRQARTSDKLSARMLGTLEEGLIPFKKTPLNILKSGIEYSPLNIVQDAVKAVRLAKGTNNVKASDLIESMSKTLTGTGMVALGSYLYDKGYLLSSTDDEYYQDNLEGKQNYSIKFKNPVNGKTYTATIDFAAPSVMPLLLGAEVKKVWDANGKKSDDFWTRMKKVGSDFDSMLNAASTLADPIMETSMLSGLNDTLKSVANAARDEDNRGSEVGSIAANIGLSYAMQGVPTLMGQVARTIDNTRRSTYSDKTGASRTIDKQLTKLENKIPFLSKKNEAYIDTYGRKQKNAPTDNIVGRALYQTLSPSYIQEVKPTKGDKLARSVYNKTKDADVFADLKTSKSIDGQKLSKEDYTTYAKAYGKSNREIRDTLAQSKEFKSLDKKTQEIMLKKIDGISDKIGESKVNKNFVTDSEYYKAYVEGGMDAVTDLLIEDAVITDYDVNPSQTTRELYETEGKKGVEAYKAITSTPCGKDKNGKTKYLSYGKGTREAYDGGYLEKYAEASQVLDNLGMDKKNTLHLVQQDNIDYAMNHNENQVKHLKSVEESGNQAQWTAKLLSLNLSDDEAYDIIMTMTKGEFPKALQGKTKQQIVSAYYGYAQKGKW